MEKTKPTAKALCEYLGKGSGFMDDMKKDRHLQWEIMMRGWIDFCKENS